MYKGSAAFEVLSRPQIWETMYQMLVDRMYFWIRPRQHGQRMIQWR